MNETPKVIQNAVSMTGLNQTFVIYLCLNLGWLKTFDDYLLRRPSIFLILSEVEENLITYE